MGVIPFATLVYLEWYAVRYTHVLCIRDRSVRIHDIIYRILHNEEPKHSSVTRENSLIASLRVVGCCCIQLKAGKFQVKPYWGLDLGSEHERYITERVRIYRCIDGVRGTIIRTISLTPPVF